MTLADAIPIRHSVRSYTSKPIEADKLAILEEEIKRCNARSGICLKLVQNDPSVFDSFLARYGKFRNVFNCIVASYPSTAENGEELCGFYGERLVLLAQNLGLNTCWVGMTFNKKAARKHIPQDYCLAAVIALGYGESQGKPHRSKSYSDVCDVPNPSYRFRRGVEAALLAPTGLNRQNFHISRDNVGKPVLTAGKGEYSNIDLGIVKCHFELVYGCN